MKEYLNKNHIECIDRVDCWEDSIIKSSKALLNNGYINESYVNGMIQSVIDNGPYMVILPEIAMPHTDPNKGVIKTGISLLKVNEPVIFPENKPVRLLITLAATSGDEHMNLLAKLTDFLIDEEKIKSILACSTKEEIMDLV